MANVSIPNTFVDGTTADADEVNDNFTALKDYINARNGGTAAWDNLKSTTALYVAATTDQLVLGDNAAFYTTITVPAPAATRTYTVPDAGAAAEFLMSVGAQTISGAKTFNDLRGTFGANIAAGSFKITGLAAGSSDGDSVRYEQVKSLWGYRRPVLQYVSATTVDAEANNPAASSTSRSVYFSDGDFRTVTSSTLYRFDITRNAALSGSKQSGLRSGLSEASDTWYALYAVKATDNATDWVLVGDTVLPLVANYATLNSNFGTNGWVYLGMIRNGDSASGGGDIVPFTMTGNITTFTVNASSALPGIQFATGNDPQTYTYAAGTGDLQVPNNLTHIIWGTRANGTASATAVSIADSGGSYFCGLFGMNGATHNVQYRHIAASTEGCQISVTGATATVFIFVSGFIDGALGIGANPLI